MKITLNDASVFASTGGREFDPKGDVLLFIHGSGQSHLSFALQGRFLANRGWQVLVPDMPAHGLSGGEPLTSIEAMAAWYIDFLDAMGVAQAHVIGHSQGGLVGLEMAANHSDRVASLSLIATALAIPVNDALLGMAEKAEPKAIAAMIDWGHGIEGHRHDHTMPGQSHLRYGTALMAANESGVLFADLTACVAYTDGPDAAAKTTCPTNCILAEKDKMTPIKQGRKMAAALNSKSVVELAHAGHMLPSEKPYEVNIALRAFLDDLV